MSRVATLAEVELPATSSPCPGTVALTTTRPRGSRGVTRNAAASTAPALRLCLLPSGRCCCSPDHAPLGDVFTHLRPLATAAAVLAPMNVRFVRCRPRSRLSPSGAYENPLAAASSQARRPFRTHPLGPTSHFKTLKRDRASGCGVVDGPRTRARRAQGWPHDFARRSIPKAGGGRGSPDAPPVNPVPSRVRDQPRARAPLARSRYPPPRPLRVRRLRERVRRALRQRARPQRGRCCARVNSTYSGSAGRTRPPGQSAITQSRAAGPVGLRAGEARGRDDGAIAAATGGG